MKKYVLPFVILLVAMSITSCSTNNEDNNEISILGEWTHHSTTDANGNETVFTNTCPNVLSIFTKTITITDYNDVAPPCEDFDLTTIDYLISGNTITTTSGGSSQSYEIATLNTTTLKLKSNNNVVIEYRRTL